MKPGSKHTPRIAQKRSGSSFALVFTVRPSANTTVAERRLSKARPYSALRRPYPPPDKDPATPINQTNAPTTSSPNFWVSSYTSPQRAPPCTVTLCLSSDTTTLFSPSISITNPPLELAQVKQWFPPHLTAISIGGECDVAYDKMMGM